MLMVTHGPYGAHRSALRPGLADHRAWTATAVPLPNIYLDPLMPALPVEDQEQSSMCVAFASTEIRRWWLRKLGYADAMLSAPYVYARGHQLVSNTGEGMQPVWAADALERYGAPPWADDPLSTASEGVAQAEAASPASLDALAAPHRVSAAGPVDPADAAAMQAAIMHAPVLLAIPVYASMGVENPIPDGHGGWVILPPADLAQAQVIGGHAIVAWGWRNWYGSLQWRIRNSWGPAWAEGGNAWLDSTHPVWEAWSMTCALDPRCVWYRQSAASARAWLDAHPDVPASWRADLLAYAAAQDAASAALGCP